MVHDALPAQSSALLELHRMLLTSSAQMPPSAVAAASLLKLNNNI
jgi:hypothetical protein